MTTYSQNIPMPSDDPSQSQDQILQNFQSLNTSNSVNHVAYNDADQGKHKFVQMPEQAGDPGTAANEGALYTKVSNSLTELFWQPESSGTAIQLTNGAVNSGASGYTFLPGNLLIQWGTCSGTSGGTSNNFPLAFSALRTVTCTALNSAAISWAISATSASAFTVTTSVAGPITFNYVAIGTY